MSEGGTLHGGLSWAQGNVRCVRGVVGVNDNGFAYNGVNVFTSIFGNDNGGERFSLRKTDLRPHLGV